MKHESWQYVDVQQGPNNQLQYSTSEWQKQQIGSKHPKTVIGTNSSTNVTFTFTGTKVEVVGFVHKNSSSTSRYFLDGHLDQMTHLELPEASYGMFTSLYTSGDSDHSGQHKLTVEHLASDGGSLLLYTFKYQNPGPVNDVAEEAGPPQHSPPQPAYPTSPESGSPSSSPKSESPYPSSPNATACGDHGGHHHSDLSGGTIAAITLGCLLAVIVITLLIVLLCRWRRLAHERTFHNLERASNPTVVHVISRDEKSPYAGEVFPHERQGMFASWLHEQQRGPPDVGSGANARIESVVFTSVYAPAGTVRTATTGRQLSPVSLPLPPSNTMRQYRDRGRVDLDSLPPTPRTAPALLRS